MLWEVVLIGANEDLESIPKQFISVNELLGLFADCEKITLEQSAQWFTRQMHILNRSKKLVLKNTYTLLEYEYNDNDFYNCPIETIKLIASGEDDEFSGDFVGFSRFQLLKDLESIGLDIDKTLILNSCAYFSQSCYENDDNFYKNQGMYLIADQKSKNQKNLPKNEKINYLFLLDPNNPNYVPAYALLLRIHYDLNFVGRFDGTKQERVATCIEEYGERYNYKNTNTNVSHLANLIKVREGVKKLSDEIKKIMSDG